MVLHVLVNIWKKVLDLGEKNSEEIFFLMVHFSDDLIITLFQVKV